MSEMTRRAVLGLEYFASTMLAREGKYLEYLKDHDSYSIRLEVAETGLYLNQLKDDEDPDVRREVIKQGEYLEYFIENDDDTCNVKLAKYLLDAKVHVVARNFGTYIGNLYLYTWANRYEIHSGCFKTGNVNRWQERCTERLGGQVAEDYTNKIKELLMGAGLVVGSPTQILTQRLTKYTKNWYVLYPN